MIIEKQKIGHRNEMPQKNKKERGVVLCVFISVGHIFFFLKLLQKKQSRFTGNSCQNSAVKPQL